VWENQTNGICGAAMRDILWLIVGTHTGHVSSSIESHDVEPVLGDEWEDVVEATFQTSGGRFNISDLTSDDQNLFELAGNTYRVRYSAKMMDEANTSGDESDEYLLQLWPARPERDGVVRQTSDYALDFHRANRQVEPDDEDLQREAAHLTRRQQSDDMLRFGTTDPGDRLRSVEVYLGELRQLDEPLMFATSNLSDREQRAIAYWVSMRALQATGIVEHPALEPAVRSLRSGAPIPPDFGDDSCWYGLADLLPKTSIPRVLDAEETVVRETYAVLTIPAAAEPDSLTAALSATIRAILALGSPELEGLLLALREAFPQLNQG